MKLECCCGEDHSTNKFWPTVLELVSRHGETVVLTTPEGGWHVPRAFIAAHGIKGVDMPKLAKQYRWKVAATA